MRDGASGDYRAAWDRLETSVTRSLEQAYAALRAGGLGCGAVLADASGAIVAEGRNHAYDPPGGNAILQGTPLAHAEMNVLAAIATDRDLSECTLVTSQEPCSMCTAAIVFTGVGAVRYVAPDLWAIAAGHSRATDAGGSPDGETLRVVGPIDDDAWVVAANVIFLLSIGRARGADHSTIQRNAELEPETTAIVLSALEGEAELPATVDGFLSALWDRISAAAAKRVSRLRSAG